MLKILEEYRTYRPSKSTGKDFMDALSMGIAEGLVTDNGDYFMLTDKGHMVVRDFSSFQEYKDYLARDLDIDKKVKTSTISNNVWSIRIAALGVIISMLIAAIPIWVNNQDSKETRAKLDTLSSEVSLLKKTNEHTKDSIKALAIQK
ncbi:hypothetical protein OHD16_06975 [Sphingobacterium sp. ML3W]|uniref:hypothetical protein n=1 Tax=Sphingobacterium sp. ML3W TaxID=1538644 RepID=UPI00249BDE8C|nr:hypothetical protein [Sphingobacterium sp. ML3W]WFA79712.1 hypothetical protein OGI71_00115 [Sphingobacterium sp. ML3W]